MPSLLKFPSPVPLPATQPTSLSGAVTGLQEGKEMKGVPAG